MDEAEKKALNEEAERINSQAATPVADTKSSEEGEITEEAVATKSEEQTPETAEEPTADGGTSKKGADARIRELNSKAKAAEEKARSLEEKIAELTAPVGQPQLTPQNGQQETYNPQDPIIAQGEEIDGAELNRRIQARDQKILQQARADSQLITRQSEAISRINSESSEVVRMYPELDPNSDDFNRDLSDSITEATEAYIRNAPYTASVKGFVAKLMKPYKGAVDKQVGKETENAIKQVSQSALRPTAVRNDEKPAREKSIKELEDELGIVQS